MAGIFVQRSVSLVSSFSLSQHRCSVLTAWLSVEHALAAVSPDLRASSDPSDLEVQVLLKCSISLHAIGIWKLSNQASIS